jgi:hypothetical protein
MDGSTIAQGTEMAMNSLAVAALVVMAGVSVVWTVILILTLQEVRRACFRLHEFIRTLEIELRPVLNQAREGAEGVARAAHEVADATARVRGALTALEDAGQNVLWTSQIFRAVFGRRLVPVAGVLAGLRAGSKVLWKQLRQRRKES